VNLFEVSHPRFADTSTPSVFFRSEHRLKM
jgi:hypothetical protein